MRAFSTAGASSPLSFVCFPLTFRFTLCIFVVGGLQMGTDIHSIAQVMRDGQWVTVAIGIDGDQRSYNTFAMLANVRNGTGFAGCRTSTGFPVIHEPRGLPDDLEVDEDSDGVLVDKSQLVCAWDWDGNEKPIDSPEAWRVKYITDEDPRMSMGDHSFSWCTLAELRAFIENVAKKTETFLVGVVSRADYEEHEKTGKPYESWYGEDGRDDHCHLVVNSIVWPLPWWDSPAGVGVVYEEGGLADFYTHVHTSWPVNAAEESRLCQIEAALSLVANRAGVNADNLRFVYGFDS